MELGNPTLTAQAAISSRTRRPGTDSDDGAPGKVEGTIPRILDWMRQNLFSSIANTALTLAVVAFLALTVPPFVEWALTGATFSGSARSDCTGDGACWTFIRIRFPQFFYGHYPSDEIWRVNLAGLLLAAFSIPVMRDNVRRRGLWLLLLLTCLLYTSPSPRDS